MSTKKPVSEKISTKKSHEIQYESLEIPLESFEIPDKSLEIQYESLEIQYESLEIPWKNRSAYERFLRILSMLELLMYGLSIKDANFEVSKKPTSVRHLVGYMIRGQPGLDELDFVNLYNNLKVYEPTLARVAMITARIRKFMRKTGRPIDLKPKNGITFDKSKIEDKDKLLISKEFKVGYVATFGNTLRCRKNLRKRKPIKDIMLRLLRKFSYVEELQVYLLSVSQICDKEAQ
ncbi:hypothetical protein Tco_0792068 [Tanacetum coccineum]